MAEDRNVQDPIDEGNEKRKEKKKTASKGLRRFMLLLFLLVGVAGAAIGLQFSGVWDARPLLYSIVPKLPYVGDRLSDLLEVPEVYTMTVEERRRYELRLWEDRLAEKELSLDELERRLVALSSDLSARRDRIEIDEARIISMDQSPESEKELSELEKADFERVVRTYQEISARRAAKIVESLDPALAVKILRSLPEDDSAKILGRMDAAKAAWLTEQLASKKR
ncbi:MgtE intracellular region [Dethiosulfovibrio sp. F2B]|uniref:MotE family protein n=1 Tax=Dethiosulfovibrio faecalis TaxID=2720018 RepID=UPI001F2E5219|nr:MgtE intracellular region [Dethiosulfovibrio faecalis]MCF4150617.1 MgtE intracellular region [Dethiosulfovibrio faecalis]